MLPNLHTVVKWQLQVKLWQRLKIIKQITLPDGEGATVQGISCIIAEAAIICHLIVCEGMLPKKQCELSCFFGACTFYFGDNS